MTCIYCQSENLEYLQDHKNRKVDGNLVGVVRCLTCKNIAYYTIKTKTKLENGIPTATAKLTVMPVLGAERPVTAWFWDQMERSSQETGRPIEAHYEHVVIA